MNNDPDGDEIVAEICGKQPNPNEPFGNILIYHRFMAYD